MTEINKKDDRSGRVITSCGVLLLTGLLILSVISIFAGIYVWVQL